jgi:hypothetical protein
MDGEQITKTLFDVGCLSSHLKSRRLIRVAPGEEGFLLDSISWPEKPDETPERCVWTGKLCDPKLAVPIMGTDASRNSFLAALCWTVGESLDITSLHRLLSQMGKNLSVGGGLANSPFLALAWTVRENLFPVLVARMLRYGRPTKSARTRTTQWRDKGYGPFRFTWADNLSTAFTSLLEGLDGSIDDHPEKRVLSAAPIIKKMMEPGLSQARGFRLARAMVENPEWPLFRGSAINYGGVVITMSLSSSSRILSLRHQLARTFVVGLERCSQNPIRPDLAARIRKDALRLILAETANDPDESKTMYAAFRHYDAFIPRIERFMECSVRAMLENPGAALDRLRAREALSVPSSCSEPDDMGPIL